MFLIIFYCFPQNIIATGGNESGTSPAAITGTSQYFRAVQQRKSVQPNSQRPRTNLKCATCKRHQNNKNQNQNTNKNRKTSFGVGLSTPQRTTYPSPLHTSGNDGDDEQQLEKYNFIHLHDKLCRHLRSHRLAREMWYL